MSGPTGSRVGFQKIDQKQISNAPQTKNIPTAMNKNGNQQHSRSEGREDHQSNGKWKKRGKRHGWKNGRGRNNYRQRRENHNHDNVFHDNGQPHDHFPVAQNQHNQHTYYQPANPYYLPGYYQQVSEHQVQQIGPYDIGYDSNLSARAMTKNAFKQSKYVQGRNRSHHLGLSPSQQQAFEQEKYHPNPSRPTFSSQETNPYALASPSFQDTYPYAQETQVSAHDDLFQHQQNVISNARAHMNVYHQQAHMNTLVYQQMQPRARQVGEGGWEMAMPNGNVRYWYEPQPYVLRVQAAEYVPGIAGVSSVAVVFVAPGEGIGTDDDDDDDVVVGEDGDGLEVMMENAEADREETADEEPSAQENAIDGPNE
ncbi:Serine/threonine-protein kinase [Venturia nashicola]|nr:Serine/threonine-protein kinase [Venturia nashicola]